MIGVYGYGRPLAARPLLRVLASFACVLVVLLSCCAGSASAEVPPYVSYGSFTAEGPGVAVDQGTGDVYTAGAFSYCKNEETEEIAPCGFGGKMQQFDAEGNLIAPFGPSSFFTGAAVNPANKDLYALSGFGAIEEYEPSTGNLVSSFSVPSSLNFFGSLTMVQIAADSAGNVYVPVRPENEVLEYSETGTLLNTFAGSGSDKLKNPTGLAVDSAGDLWVADSGNDRIVQLSPSGAFLAEIESPGARSLALDSAGDIFAIVFNNEDFCGALRPPCTHVVEYSPTGAKLADFGAGFLNLLLVTESSTIAVNAKNGRVYVTDLLKNVVRVFAPPKAPEIGHELTGDVGGTEANLGALVNAGGLPSTYRFEYGTTTAYGNVAPSPEGSASGTKAHTVWASIGGLSPGATYHFRVVVQNALGTLVGPDQTFTTTAQSNCSNEALRTGLSAQLPDCRAYEMVTQPNTASAEPDSSKGNGIQLPWGRTFTGGGFTANHAARNGNRFSYWALEVMPGAKASGMEYLAMRGKDGWSSETQIPLQSYTNIYCNEPTLGNAFLAYSSQLTEAVLRVGANERAGLGGIPSNATGGCGGEVVELVSGEPLGVENLLLRDPAGDYQLINTPPSNAIPEDAHFEGATSDLGRVFFKETSPLTEHGPTNGAGLYEWDEGALRLVSVLPNGTPVPGSLATEWNRRPSVISADGSHVFFTAEGNLYVRVDGERTEQLDEPQGGSGAGGGGQFQAASPDGTQVYFLDSSANGLTADTVEGSGMNLYRYAGGQLTDLTAAAEVEAQRVVGLSPEGVYFTAIGALTGSQANANGGTAQAGQLNLYEWQDGTITYVATTEGGATAVSPNGAFLAFTSKLVQTGYDNKDQRNGLSDPEIYLYNSASKELTCASCEPSGEAPSAEGATLSESEEPEFPGQGAPHHLMNDGRIVFQTAEALLQGDTNGRMDVYEYEQGQLHLISSGTANSAAQLLDTSEDGKDIFFVSRQPLLAQQAGGEGETNIIYDAREGGGFPAAVSPPPCVTAEACRVPAPAQPSIFGAPSSQTFSGAGNVVSQRFTHPKAKKKSTKAKPKRTKKCRKGYAKSKGKCVKRKPARKSRKSNHKGRR